MSDGISFPAIKECPECGYGLLSGVEISRQGVVLALDGAGGVARDKTEALLDTTYTMLECPDCETRLVEDGEIVHEGVPEPDAGPEIPGPGMFEVRVEKTTRVHAQDRDAALRRVRNALGGSGWDLEIVGHDQQEVSPPYAIIKFHPQAWQDDYARPVDPEGEQTWKMPLCEVLGAEGQLPEDNSYESDPLRRSRFAPLWVRNYSGPFRVSVEEVVPGPEYETVDAAIAGESSSDH